jgi:hypothetical protein
MIKNSVVVLVTSALLLGAAAPAMAVAPAPVEESTFDDDYVLTLLAEKGIDANSVEEWGSSYLVAWVANDQGGQTMIYLDPDTLEVVTP